MNILVLSIIIFLFIYLYLLIIHLLPEIVYKKRIRQKEGMYYELLLKGIKQGTIEEDAIFDIYTCFNENLSDVFITFSVPYDSFLKSFLFYVREKDEDGEITKKVTQVLKPILDKNKDLNPYENVDEGQRRILLSIEDTIKNSSTITLNERAAIKHNLNVLANAIVEKQEELLHSKKVNKWTMPITIFGVLATIVFGIIQLFQR